MHSLPRSFRSALLPLILAVAAPGLAAAQSSPQTNLGSPFERLFLGFMEEAAVVEQQWWEGRAFYDLGDNVDVVGISGVAAFQPVKRLEIGATAGFADSDTEGNLPDGSGATDMDVWGKWYFGRGRGDRNTVFAAGGSVTLPLGDDTAGLGNDAFGVGVFGSARHRFERDWTLSINAGLRATGDGMIFGVDIDGETSAIIGAGAVFDVGDGVSLVAEGRFESKRFKQGDSDARLLGGVNWGWKRGIWRSAVALGLSDGAPDVGLQFGYAAQF